jgi:release factor glutamine methyltransferase
VTLAECVRAASGALVDAGLPAEESRRDAALLARHALGWNLTRWLADRDDEAPPGFARGLDALIRRRASREPVAYITGVREFYGRPFRVTPAVLIPRQETELVVEEALAVLAAYVRPGARPLVADVGTGSGCLAVSLALEHPDARIVATDISADALEVARGNASALGAADRILFRAGPLLAGLDEAPDLIVSNPPYVPEADRPTLAPEVRDFEPDAALFSGLDGLDTIRALVPAASRALAPGGTLVMEFGAGQAPAVTRLVAEAGLRLDRIRLDLQRIPRVVIASRT